MADADVYRQRLYFKIVSVLNGDSKNNPYATVGPSVVFTKKQIDLYIKTKEGVYRLRNAITGAYDDENAILIVI